MIDSIIIKYLQENRRLVIPKLGAFIVKDDNWSIVFSELLRGDDGVLRGLIKQHGVGDIEAAGVIDRFVFEVRHTLDRNMPYKIGNLGSLRRDEKGRIVFLSFRAQLQQPVERQTPRPLRKVDVVTPPASDVADNHATEEENTSVEKVRRHKPRRKPDIFMIVAIVVSVLAICAILYGVLCNGEDGESMPEPMPFSEIESVEQGMDGMTDIDAKDLAPLN